MRNCSAIERAAAVFSSSLTPGSRLSLRDGIHDASSSFFLPRAMVQLLSSLVVAGFVGLSLGQEKW